MSVIDTFHFQGDELDVIKEGETLWVSVRRVCDALGLDKASQMRKLKEKEWASVVIMTTDDVTGRNREHFMIDLDSLPMWLATIESNRVAEHIRPKLVAYQKEAAKALRDYFFKGYAVNDQRFNQRQMEQALLLDRQKAALECINILSRGTLFNPQYLQRKAEHLIAEIKGIEASNDNRLIDVSSFLKSKGLPQAQIQKTCSRFGILMKSLYVDAHGIEPKQCHRFINGSERMANSYTEEDLPLFEKAFEIMFKQRGQLPCRKSENLAFSFSVTPALDEKNMRTFRGEEGGATV